MPPIERPFGEVAIERDGVRHVGSYELEKAVVRVTYRGGGAFGGVSKVAQADVTSAKSIAMILLSELVTEYGDDPSKRRT